jgi:tRNA-specific 2-thiouridylase
LELQAGRTPSPDLWCNERIKFGAFLDHIDSPSFDKIASGHYARLRETAEGTQLLRAKDPVKDQTYFLSRLRPEQLQRCLFPIGDYLKSEVRALAEEFSLVNRQRKDSQGICFLGKIAYDDFVASYLGEEPGDIRDLDSGRILGQHRGYWFHTIGQRKGLGLGGGPWYVVRKDVASNTLYVTHQKNHHQHRLDRFQIPKPHWIFRPPTTGQRLDVKLRHSPTACRCDIEPGIEGGLSVHLAEEDPGVAPGQSAVFYQEEVCLGGGIIETAPQEPAASR